MQFYMQTRMEVWLFITWYATSLTLRIVKDVEECKPEGIEDNDAVSTIKPTLDNACPTKDVIQKKPPSNNSASLVLTQAFIYMYTTIVHNRILKNGSFKTKGLGAFTACQPSCVCIWCCSQPDP